MEMTWWSSYLAEPGAPSCAVGGRGGVGRKAMGVDASRAIIIALDGPGWHYDQALGGQAH